MNTNEERLPEITPDVIARLASRIYNERPASDTPSPNSVASWTPPLELPGSAASEAPSIPRPLAGSSFAPHDVQHLGVPAMAPQVLAAPPAATVAGSLGALHTQASQPVHVGHDRTTPSHSQGLKSFVQQVRAVRFDDPVPWSRATRPSFNGHPLTQQALTPDSSLASNEPWYDPTLRQATHRPFDVHAIRRDFPVLHQQVHGQPLAWFDNAATTQKPQAVIDAIARFYQRDNSNIHRGAHTLAARATDAYENARERVRSFLGAQSPNEIVFVRGTTEGINLVAHTYGRKFLRSDDEIIVSHLEHHANIVPWQMIARESGARLRVIPVNDRGEIILEEYQQLLGPRTKIVALTQANNSLGTVLPVAEMTAIAKRYGARVLIDGAQSVAHIPVDVQHLGCDFFVFSGHKIFGPTGIGAVYIREELHDIVPPWQGGGNMIRNVTFEETTYNEAPAKFEAGTPNIADAVGLHAALDYVSQLGLPHIAAHERSLLEYATAQLTTIPNLRLIGNAHEKVAVISFVLNSHSNEAIGKALDQAGIAVRVGHHCAQPSLRRFGVETTVRPSFSIYNTHDEIDRLVGVLRTLSGERPVPIHRTRSR